MAKLFSRKERTFAMAERRKISAAERKERDALMRVLNWVNVLVIRRLFDEGWTNEQVALAFGQIQREAGNRALAHALPGWQYVDENKLADEVYAAVKEG
jgi:hypothetical protein